jgi:hypothetical protein
MFKNILHPKQHKVLDQAPATTTFKLQVQDAQDTHMVDQNVAAPVEDCCWPPLGTHLGHLPSHLVSCISYSTCRNTLLSTAPACCTLSGITLVVEYVQVVCQLLFNLCALSVCSSMQQH